MKLMKLGILKEIYEKLKCNKINASDIALFKCLQIGKGNTFVF